MKFDSINFEKLDTSYENSVDDLSTEIFIFSKNKITHIKGQSASLPQNVVQVYSWFFQSIKQMKFEKSKDRFNFPTIIEKPIPAPRR